MQLNDNQKAVVLKLLPRVQHLRWKGLTAAQIKQTLVVAEGWPVGAVDATLSWPVGAVDAAFARIKEAKTINRKGKRP